ncbi:DUF2243 domain-containing protein [Paenibacillus sedimenti]|uniref:DUF2243 domain-containing protein n=1 Tax=Paenibacillus sedimenti TaxID=2770274 RepID=A0A926QLX6_9BACL|nr:DUF2243 domain-containing protein [Paenibacillus sedimenti]MBD0382839.1 DUF2243 domain-containing protein [Paenibacillus sedimenti]
MKFIGAVVAFFVTDFFFHVIEAFAAGLKADTPLERIGAVFCGIIVLLILMAVFHKFFSKSFFNGFTVATGLFLSFDIVVFHWIFQIHRITNGPEANWLEPVFVVTGIIFVTYGIKKEGSSKITS